MSLVETDPAPKPGMRAKVIEEYATLFRTHGLAGPVLEIAGGSRDGAVANAPFLQGLERHVVLAGDGGEANGVHFHKGDPNDLAPLFDDGCFSAVIWDRALERDPRFWLTAAEIRRVLAPGGSLVVCTRGFGRSNKFGVKVVGASGNPITFMTATAAVAAAGGDHMRLSPQGLRRLVLDGFDVKELRSSFMTPHLFAVAQKPR
ncbi:methyltransferase domain-containing protein [Lichenibacterium dinghuense]|uniref:methyltransferase domain-containing protein n=1 Tax=Lichenibacterium dinghuense TaxID=2895977 RepID=UPI001EFF88CB|nr:methyltransferase domain-containing protein [Lichenibacterium sp. 6Y81]